MIPEWELLAVANTVLKQHGENAAAFIAGRIADLEKRGDTAGADTWSLIMDRLVELCRCPEAGESVQ